MKRRNRLCVYCGEREAVSMDHVPPNDALFVMRKPYVRPSGVKKRRR